MKYIDKWIIEAIENEKKNHAKRMEDLEQMKHSKITAKEFCKRMDCGNCPFLLEKNCQKKIALLSENEIE